MGLGRWSTTGAWTAGAAALAGLLSAGYLSLRAGGSRAETAAVVGALAAAAAGLAAWQAQRGLRRRVSVLESRLAALRDNPSPQRLEQCFGPGEPWGELAPLLGPLQALAGSYAQALRELVRAQEILEGLRAFQERADVERGYSLSFVRRGGDVGRASPRLVARLAPDLTWMAATPALQQFLGRGIAALSGHPLLDVVHPEDAPALSRAFQDALRDGEGHNITFRILVPPPPGLVGAAPPPERHVQMDLVTRYTNEGAPLHLRCHLLDVTEKVRIDEELRARTVALAEANERLRQTNADLERLKEGYRDLYHQAPMMYFSLDAGGHFTTCNETLLRSLGYRREEVFGQPYGRVLAPAARAAYERNSAAYRVANEIETQWLKKDGTVIDVWIRTAPQQDEQGRFVRSRSAAQDVTERRRLLHALVVKQRELERANEQLRRSNRELDRFTHVVSHDLREPLRTLEAFSNFLAQDYGDQLGPEGRDYINHLVEASRRLGALIGDLLLLSRAGRVISTPRPVDLREAFRTVHGDLHDLIQRREAVVRLDDSMAGCPAVAGDPQRLMELLANLVGNGLKYNTSPRPEVVLGYRPGSASSNGPVTLYVRDNGIGIDPEYHEQVFQLFRRLHHRDEYEGTGAGLAICRQIVEAHGGWMWVESSAGRGSTFLFTLPRSAEHQAEGEPAVAGCEQGKEV
jgi:PAS domain S-box-containing protein